MNRKKLSVGKLAAAIVAGGAAMVAAQEAHAVPAFARQLGVSCAACHTVEPQLTSFGRQFKSLAYTFNSGSNNTISYEQNGEKRLAIDKIPPIALMMIADESWSGKANNASGTPNPSADFPGQYSLFYAGRAGTDLGVFSQLTWDPTTNSVGIDNTDVRYAKETPVGNGNLVWGLDVNNAPGVGDLWQDTPIWGFPFYSPVQGNAGNGGPIGTVLGNVTLQANSVGAGGYVWYNNTYYAQVMLYRGMVPGSTVNTLNGTISNVAPYWRLAYSHEGGVNSWEIGTFGIYGKSYAVGMTSGPQAKYLDTALDGQYEHVATNYSYTIRASYIHESLKVPNAMVPNSTTASGNTTGSVNQYQINGQYYWHRKYGVVGQYFGVSGSTNANLWGDSGANTPVAAPALLSNGGGTSSINGSPDTSGEILQVNYLPWINTKFGVQYVAFNKFDGSSTNASYNNTLSVFMWLMM
ncbi:hypothetical protein BJI67_01935 [Acidihalobacter aeolianus]|uniref:Cyc2 n=2 Tax=Acidihalobacter TaxID=1765964 RepID=B2ZFM8_9GAMM|nr:hypothetical protein [Acidihalobacter aeolianus]ACD03837.1 Cyc2 [Acidihalobacter aeolianus]AOV15996.1 hypothetical protein BJI67_01935 [Acidihalobacter aeolianus]